MKTSQFNFAAITTANNYNAAEVTSALQKSIRRSDIEGACFWASELDLSGYAEHCWRRMRIIASEDCSADPHLPASIGALYDAWRDLRKREDRHHAERLPFLHAVTLLCRAEKSRVVDHLCVLMYAGREKDRPIPDVALDRHTLRGRRMERGWKHFWNEASRLIPEPTLPDPFAERAQRILHDVPNDEALFGEL